MIISIYLHNIYGYIFCWIYAWYICSVIPCCNELKEIFLNYLNKMELQFTYWLGSIEKSGCLKGFITNIRNTNPNMPISIRPSLVQISVISTNAGSLLIGSLETNFSKIWIKTHCHARKWICPLNVRVFTLTSFLLTTTHNLINNMETSGILKKNWYTDPKLIIHPRRTNNTAQVPERYLSYEFSLIIQWHANPTALKYLCANGVLILNKKQNPTPPTHVISA